MIRTSERYTKWNGDKGTRYYKYIPSNGVKPIGTILFFHGYGERSATDLTLVDNNGLPAYLKVDGVKDGAEIPLIVICPQEEPPAEWYSRAIDCVDLAKIFGLPIHKCGLSLGSMVDSEIINHFGVNPFRSIASCCGKINEFPNTITEFGKVPVISYYDPADKTVQNGAGYASTKSVHDKLKAAGKDSTMIEYTGVGHGVWAPAYKPGGANNYIDWLMSKVNIGVTPIPPVEKEAIREQYIENGKLVTMGVNGTKIIN